MLYLSVNTSSTQGSAFAMVAQLFFILVVFIAVVALAIFTTKWIAKSKYSAKGSGNLKIVESMSMGYQGGIHLLKCGKKYILLGIVKDRITVLSELEEDQIETYENESVPAKKVFERYLTNFLQKNGNGKDDENAPN